MSTKFSKECNVMCALLGEETVVPRLFFESIGAAIANADTCPPKSWEDVYHDLGAGFPVDCSWVRYVDEDSGEQDGEAESQPETHTPKKKPKTATAPHLVARSALKPRPLRPKALWPLLPKV